MRVLNILDSVLSCCFSRRADSGPCDEGEAGDAFFETLGGGPDRHYHYNYGVLPPKTTHFHLCRCSSPGSSYYTPSIRMFFEDQSEPEPTLRPSEGSMNLKKLEGVLPPSPRHLNMFEFPPACTFSEGCVQKTDHIIF